PASQSAVACDDGNIVLPVGEIEVPVEILDILHQIADADLEIGKRDIIVDSCDQHALIHTRDGAEVRVDRTGDSGELNAATREQRLTEADSGRSRVGRLKEL